jgi:NADPH:quinone reductase-like Zn-dependent oxidoreductase
VITTLSTDKEEFVRSLGADEILDYRAKPFEDQLQEIDIIFDTVGGETLDRSSGVLKGNGWLVTIAAESEAMQEERVKKSFFIVEPRHEQLLEIGKQIEAGELRPVVDTVLPLSQVADAYKGKAKKKGRGKLVVIVIGSL